MNAGGGEVSAEVKEEEEEGRECVPAARLLRCVPATPESTVVFS